MRPNIPTILRVLLPVMCMTLLWTATTACSDGPPLSGTQTATTAVIRPIMFRHGRYIYESGNRMKRYDPASHIQTPACLTPDCGGTCPLDSVITEINGIYDGRLYFYSFEAFTHKVMLGYQDLISGEVKVLVELSEAEQGSTKTHVHDGYLYYQCKRLRDGGDPSDPNDYEASISRVSVDGGRAESVCKPGGKGLLMGVEDQLILEQNAVLYTYNIADGEIRELYDLGKGGFTLIKSGIFSARGRLCFLASTGAVDGDATLGFSHLLTYLVSIDLHTGRGGKLLEAPVEFFDMDESGIYYIPYQLRVLHIPDDFEEDDDPNKLSRVLLSTQDAHLWACDLDGGNSRKVAEKLDFDPVATATVVDGELYGTIKAYDMDAHTSEILTGAVDLTSGEVIRVAKEEDP